MNKIIDLIDSDDETNVVTSTTNVDIKQEVKPLIEISNIPTSQNTNEAAPSSTTNISLNDSNITGAGTSISSNCSDQSLTPPTLKRVRQRARKTQHQTIRLSPDMQFETIALDDDDEDGIAVSAVSGGYSSNDTAEEPPAKQPALEPLEPNQQPTTSRQQRVTPKLQATSTTKTTPAAHAKAAVWHAATEEFLNDPQTAYKLRQIAEERTRVNFLLNSYRLPSINFGLYSNYEKLKAQFSERIKRSSKQKAILKTAPTSATAKSKADGPTSNIRII